MAMQIHAMTFVGSKIVLGAVCAIVVSGCATPSYQPNAPLSSQAAPSYTIRALGQPGNSDSLMIITSLSGGGHRAAAFGYSVLESLSRTRVTWEGQDKRLIDELDGLVAVSGGSLTASYYALHRDATFSNFVRDVLQADIQSQVVSRMLSPRGLWRAAGARFGRGDILQEVLDETVFRGATYADLPRLRPMLVINATEMVSGELFQFAQEQFDDLCSDLGPMPLARSVAASMAVPILFSPITLWNYREQCPAPGNRPPWVTALRHQPFVHLMDGGLADNLGVRGPLEMISGRGGLLSAFAGLGLQTPRKVVFIVANAQVAPEFTADSSPDTPGLLRQLRAMVDIPINRYSNSSMQTLRTSIEGWKRELAAYNAARPPTEQRHVEFYAIDVSAESANDVAGTKALRDIPTSLRLSGEQVETVLRMARQRLAADPDFQRLLSDLNGTAIEDSSRPATGG